MIFSEQIVVVILRNFDVLGDVTGTPVFTKTRRSNCYINVSKNQPAIIQWRHSILFQAKLRPLSSNPSNFICGSGVILLHATAARDVAITTTATIKNTFVHENLDISFHPIPKCLKIDHIALFDLGNTRA